MTPLTSRSTEKSIMTVLESSKTQPQVLKDISSQEPAVGQAFTSQLDVELSITKNLGNYESARISVRLSRPSSLMTLDEDFKMTRDWVESKIKQELDTINKGAEVTADSNFEF